jgi:hypothetical protein
MSINARMTMARLGVEADELLAGIVTFRPPDSGDEEWACFCSNPPEPYVAFGRTGREAFAKLLRWIQKRRVVYR